VKTTRRKIGFVADVHVHNFPRFGGPARVGVNGRCRLVVEALERACAAAYADGCSDLVVLGDLFDRSDPSPQVLRAARDALVAHPLERVWLLTGNHDQVSSEPGDHAFAPLDGFYREGGPRISVVDEPGWRLPGGAVVAFVPFRPGDARGWLAGALAEAVDQRPSGPLIVALHLGIVDTDTPAFLRKAHDAIELPDLGYLAQRCGASAVLAGNWHRRRLWQHGEVAVVQVGALCPTGFSDAGSTGYGTLAVYDSDEDSLAWEEVPGPRFLSGAMPEVSAQLAEAQRDQENESFVRVKAARVEMEEALAWLAARRASGDVADGEVVVDEFEARAAAATAAHAARHAGTLEDALAHYVTAMDLPDGVDRQAVLEQVRGYLT